MGLEPGEERAADAERVGHGGAILRRPLVAVGLGVLFTHAACSPSTSPWDEPTGGAPKFATDAGPPPPAETAVAAVASDGRLESGGIFVDCRGGLVATADANRDVRRLGLACGPVAGMKALTDTPFEGTLSVGSADLEFPVKLEKGRCYRVFVASESTSAEITVDVVSSHGLPIASESTADGLATIPSTRPLCALGDDAVNLRASMRCAPSSSAPRAPCPKAGVRFAVAVWAR